MPLAQYHHQHSRNPHGLANWLADLSLRSGPSMQLVSDNRTPLPGVFSVLSATQKTELFSVLEDFCNLPLTQHNYELMQDTLQGAGLMPEQVYVAQEADQPRNDRYMSGIVQSWERLSSHG